jgi:hypothetical protein
VSALGYTQIRSYLAKVRRLLLIGAEGRWWNRKLPGKRILIIVSLLLVAGWSYLYLQPVLTTCIWTVTHRSTAAYNGYSFKVPWMWRQEETPAGQRQVRLVRARLGEPVAFESIVISDDTTSLSPRQTITQRLEMLGSKLGQDGFHGVPLQLAPEIARQYSCMEPHFNALRNWQASCLSNDNLWSINLFGPVPDPNALEVVLSNFASVQKPTVPNTDVVLPSGAAVRLRR